MPRTWMHTVCEKCWFQLRPDRMPNQVIREPDDLSIDTCCRCGTPKVTRIWVRISPDEPTLLCHGEHGPDL